MKKLIPSMPTIIGFLLVPVLAVVRLIRPASLLDYGNRVITDNSVLLLAFGIFCVFVSTFNLIRAHKSWKAANSKWKMQTLSAYVSTTLFALALAFLIMFTGRGYEYGSSLQRHGVSPEAFLYGLIFVSPAFLFPIGLVLLTLAFAGLPHRKTRPKSYLVLTFLASVLFTFGGAIPVFLVGAFWLGGGLALCYCPVNRKTSPKNLVLRPLYRYRRRCLRNQLNI